MVAVKMERKVQMQKTLWMINSQNFMTEPKEREYVKTILRLWLWENSDTYYNQNEKKKK